jgi:hypothetical protein
VDAAAAGAGRRNTRMPKYSKFTQQELPACKPILTPKWVSFYGDYATVGSCG